jgi:hypothetical protein
MKRVYTRMMGRRCQLREKSVVRDGESVLWPIARQWSQIIIHARPQGPGGAGEFPLRSPHSTLSFPHHSGTFSSCRPTTALSELLFVYDFDLLIDHLPGKPVDRHVHPVVLLAFDEEARKSGSAGRIAPALGYYINQKVPCASLERV